MYKRASIGSRDILQQYTTAKIWGTVWTCWLNFNDGKIIRKVHSLNHVIMQEMILICMCRLLKRLIDYGEAGVALNVFEALSMIVTSNGQLSNAQKECEFLFNTLVSFQLHLKRLLTKCIDDQARCLHFYSISSDYITWIYF